MQHFDLGPKEETLLHSSIRQLNASLKWHVGLRITILCVLFLLAMVIFMC